MFEIEIPFPIKGIPLKPELRGRQKVDEKLIQTLAAIMGFDGEARRLLSCALNGSLHTVSPAVKAIDKVIATGDAETVSFADISTTEILVKSRLWNTSHVVVNVNAAATAAIGFRLYSGEWLKVSINNMSQLSLYFPKSGAVVDIVRTV